MMKERLNKLAERLPKWERIQNRMMMSVSAQIADIIDEKFNSRKEFADALGKKESEISKWLSGTHNFTLKSLAKIEEQLGEQFIFTLSETEEHIAKSKSSKDDFIYRANRKKNAGMFVAEENNSNKQYDG